MWVLRQVQVFIRHFHVSLSLDDFHVSIIKSIKYHDLLILSTLITYDFNMEKHLKNSIVEVQKLDSSYVNKNMNDFWIIYSYHMYLTILLILFQS